jgi:hypothetical protein
MEDGQDAEMADNNPGSQAPAAKSASGSASLLAEEEYSSEGQNEDDDGSDGGGEKKKGKGGKGRRVVSPRVNALQIWSFKQKKYIYEVNSSFKLIIRITYMYTKISFL